MSLDISDEALRRFVVRIVTVERQPLGSGVFVAPGWVLTCAHVVEELGNVVLVPDERASRTGRPLPEVVTGTVQARTAGPVPGSASGFWPFPDLALVKADWADHVVAPLSTRGPAAASRPHAYGFGRREAGVTAVGSPSSFDFVGVDGDGYLALKADYALPGLSGGPLVCPVRRAVVGLMSVSRDVNEPNGGWASPVGWLTAPSWDSQIDPGQAVTASVLEHNREAAWLDRDAWLRVLPVDDVIVDRPWEGARIESTTGHPSTMLRAEFAVVPYLFRDAELTAVEQWCAGRERFSIRHVDALGGAGKTRFAIEACRIQDRRGWVTGFLPSDRSLDVLRTARLVVLDYVDESDAGSVAERLDALWRSSSELEPVRVLLLSRPAIRLREGRPHLSSPMAPLQQSASGATLAALDAAGTFAAVDELSDEQRIAMFDRAYREFGSLWRGDSWVPSTVDRDLTATQYARPLEVLFEAFDAALSDVGGRPSRPPVERVLDHELRHWKTRMPGVDPALLIESVALVTLAGAQDESESQALLTLLPLTAEPDRRRLDRWLRGTVRRPGPLERLAP